MFYNNHNNHNNMKSIFIKLTKVSRFTGPFTIKDNLDNILEEHVSREVLLEGKSYGVEDEVLAITISSEGDCVFERTVNISQQYESIKQTPLIEEITTGCVWKHLENPEIFNNFYDKIDPYIIEYPFAYSVNDEILKSIKDYSKVFQYTKDELGGSNEVKKIELDDVWFNKAILYNGQQCSGILNLVPKPKKSLKGYSSYPLYKENSKSILFTKSDNFYKYNTFWSVVKDVKNHIFVRTCKSLSYDKELNQTNMDYSKRSFNKSPLRAKDLKVRQMLDNRSDVCIISQFLLAPTQVSHK